MVEIKFFIFFDVKIYNVKEALYIDLMKMKELIIQIVLEKS